MDLFVQFDLMHTTTDVAIASSSRNEIIRQSSFINNSTWLFAVMVSEFRVQFDEFPSAHNTVCSQYLSDTMYAYIP